MRSLFDLPRFEDRSGFIFIEHINIFTENHALVISDKDGKQSLPIAKINYLMLGPGTNISHSAVKLLTEMNVVICWVGEEGIRTYSNAFGGTFSSKRLLFQASIFVNPNKRREVCLRMYRKRYPNIPDNLSIEQMKGLEGIRVKKEYIILSKKYNIEWNNRRYNQNNWNQADLINKALSVANSCLYGICHSAILSGGFSPAIGFIHTGQMLSFVFDMADLYKSEIIFPLAFKSASTSNLTDKIEYKVRRLCRDSFVNFNLIKRIIPDIKEVLNVSNDFMETEDELTRKIVSMAK